jgi:hypothetical protein
MGNNYKNPKFHPNWRSDLKIHPDDGTDLPLAKFISILVGIFYKAQK